MNTMKKLIAAGLIASLFAFSLNAQTAPNASVDDNGNLVLEDGSVVPVPDGTVDAGDLVLSDGTRIAAPTATVNPDGSLTLDDGSSLSVPALPQGGAFVVSWFGSDLYDYDAGLAPDNDQQYFSFTYKNIFHYAASNWFFVLEMKSSIFIFPDSGNKFWAYTNNLFPGQSSGIFMFLAGSNGFSDLRDSNGDGTNDLPDGEAGNQTLDGTIYVTDASGYDANGAGWFWFSEYADGNWIKRLGDDNSPWVKLTDPVQ
jgi:hypothetical protein